MCNKVRGSYEVILQRKMVLSSKFYILSRILDYVQYPMEKIGQLHKLLHDLINISRKRNLFIFAVYFFKLPFITNTYNLTLFDTEGPQVTESAASSTL